jgi:membrane protein implicated in regulation of membrane protease activity
MSASPAPPARGPVTLSRVVAGICLIAPFVTMLWVSSYARISPTLIGIPFFYWYQMAWVIGSAVLIAIAYTLVRREERARRAADAAATRPEGESS